MFDNELRPLMAWFVSTMRKLILPSSRVKHNQVDRQLHQTCWSCWWVRTIISSVISGVTDLIVSVVLYLVLAFFLYSPFICASLSYLRLGELNHCKSKSNEGDTEPNLKPGMYLFILLSLCCSRYNLPVYCVAWNIWYTHCGEQGQPTSWAQLGSSFWLL